MPAGGQRAGFHRERECLERAVRALEPKRIRFGTDGKRTDLETPLEAPHAQHKRQLGLVTAARIPDAAKELSPGENLARLLAEVRV